MAEIAMIGMMFMCGSAVVGGGGYYYMNNKDETTTTPLTAPISVDDIRTQSPAASTTTQTPAASTTTQTPEASTTTQTPEASRSSAYSVIGHKYIKVIFEKQKKDIPILDVNQDINNNTQERENIKVDELIKMMIVHQIFARTQIPYKNISSYAELQKLTYKMEDELIDKKIIVTEIETKDKKTFNTRVYYLKHNSTTNELSLTTSNSGTNQWSVNSTYISLVPKAPNVSFSKGYEPEDQVCIQNTGSVYRFGCGYNDDKTEIDWSNTNIEVKNKGYPIFKVEGKCLADQNLYFQMSTMSDDINWSSVDVERPKKSVGGVLLASTSSNTDQYVGHKVPDLCGEKENMDSLISSNEEEKVKNIQNKMAKSLVSYFDSAETIGDDFDPNDYCIFLLRSDGAIAMKRLFYKDGMWNVKGEISKYKNAPSVHQKLDVNIINPLSRGNAVIKRTRFTSVVNSKWRDDWHAGYFDNKYWSSFKVNPNQGITQIEGRKSGNGIEVLTLSSNDGTTMKMGKGDWGEAFSKITMDPVRRIDTFDDGNKSEFRKMKFYNYNYTEINPIGHDDESNEGKLEAYDATRAANHHVVRVTEYIHNKTKGWHWARLKNNKKEIDFTIAELSYACAVSRDQTSERPIYFRLEAVQYNVAPIDMCYYNCRGHEFIIIVQNDGFLKIMKIQREENKFELNDLGHFCFTWNDPRKKTSTYSVSVGKGNTLILLGSVESLDTTMMDRLDGHYHQLRIYRVSESQFFKYVVTKKESHMGVNVIQINDNNQPYSKETEKYSDICGSPLYNFNPILTIASDVADDNKCYRNFEASSSRELFMNFDYIQTTNKYDITSRMNNKQFVDMTLVPNKDDESFTLIGLHRHGQQLSSIKQVKSNNGGFSATTPSDQQSDDLGNTDNNPYVAVCAVPMSAISTPTTFEEGVNYTCPGIQELKCGDKQFYECTKGDDISCQ